MRRGSGSVVTPGSGSGNPLPVRWQWSRFEEISAAELYEILRLRSRVFVVEQACVYLDLDGRDDRAFHLRGWTRGADGAELLAAYARVFAPGIVYAEASIGRIVTAPEVRRMGWGRPLVREAIRRVAALTPGADIRIGAQLYLERFYEEFSFRRASAPYDEDGIPHIHMLREAGS
ncbi:GNAT family N-acetyltransferase [soil metagenome]